MCKLKILFTSLFSFGVAVAQNGIGGENLTVTISTGTIQGRIRHTSETNKTYYAFHGIPYAKPPLDELRFRAPVPAERWEGVLPAKTDEHPCFQVAEPKGSEDCLYINVFTPDVNASVLPVMVWIYGGAFFIGTSKITDYSPDYFMEENVIIVTFNYRVGVFGFLSTEDAASPGNYGLKDQILALKWVRDNIKHLGGDSRSITVFGESSGSVSLSYLLQTPLTKNLFHRAIMQSGTTLNLWGLTRNPNATAFAIGNILGIQPDNSTTLVETLRRVDAKTLQTVSTAKSLLDILMKNPRDGLVFGPTMEPPLPGAVVRGRSYVKLNHGNFNRIPCIVGFTSAEGKTITEIINYIRVYYLTFDIFFTRLVPIDMNIQSTIQKIIVALLIRQKYFGILPITLLQKKVEQFVTDDQFVRPIYEYVTLVSKFIPLYFYRFSYEGKLGTYGQDAKGRGVGHTEELPYIWNNQQNIDDPSNTDILTRRRLTKLWTNFAKTSNPTPERDDLFQQVIWPTSMFNNITYLDIGRNFTLSSDMSEYNIDFWKNLYEANGIPPYDTY